MENRRSTSQNSSKPFNRRNNFQKPAGKPHGQNDFQRGGGRFQSQSNSLEQRGNRETRGNRDERTNKFEPRNRFGRDDGKSAFPNSRFKSPQNKFSKPNRFGEQKNKNFTRREADAPPRIVSDMQITDGKHRGKYLLNIPSPNTRPTTRRVREIMFKILFRRIRAKRFLDLCAGSGMVGIEAISRGALLGTFVERSAKLCSHIRKNLAACGIKEGHGEIFEAECVAFLKRMAKRKRCWDVVFYDPPYDVDYNEVLDYFGRGVALNDKGVLVIEHPAEMFFPEKFGLMSRWRVITQGATALSFYEKT